MTQPKSSGARLMFASNSTATASSYSAGFKASVPAESFPLGQSPGGDRFRGVRMEFYNASGTATLGANVWVFWPKYTASTNATNGYTAQCIGTITGVSSTAVTIPANHLGTPGALIYDELTYAATTTGTTVKGPGAVLNTATGSAGAQVFSPNDNATPGFIIIPDVGNASHVYVETWDAAGNAHNGFIEGWT